jgi:hypothetical protein
MATIGAYASKRRSHRQQLSAMVLLVFLLWGEGVSDSGLDPLRKCLRIQVFLLLPLAFVATEASSPISESWMPALSRLLAVMFRR